MAGIYVHIPFCRKACHYCNFHFSTSLRSKDDMLSALEKELEFQKDYLGNTLIETIYLGGGTPSVLTIQDLSFLFKKIYDSYKISENPEITLEANPENLTEEYILGLKNDTPVNRLSIGIQSFEEADLLWMNRAHNAIEARMCIEFAQDANFDDLTIDLIYGTPTLSDEQWINNLQIAFDYDIPHISSYALTVEPKTALDSFIKKGKYPSVDEEKTARQFEILMEEMRRNGYIHYEISNFAQPEKFAKHNSNYWLGVPYLGIGPSAHSFDGKTRQWNAANNALYMRSIKEDKIPATREILTETQRYNEYVMTSLRTIWGCDPAFISEKFGTKYLKYFNKKILPFVQNKTIMTDGRGYFLTDSGKLLADNISMELFFD